MAPRRSRRRRVVSSPIERALADLSDFLAHAGAPAGIIGGIAVIAWGFGRSTIDVDVAMAVPTSEVGSLLRRLGRAGLSPRIPDARRFAEENYVLLLRHEATGVDVDLSLAQLEFEKEALQHVQRRQFGSVGIPVVRPTDLVVYKMIASRPRDLQDVEELLARGLTIDAPTVEARLREFDALLELDRVGEWRRLLRRLRGAEA